ncbi:hypothetical protein P43SY_011236 [Pythium insidiosum]|uniref:Uncharacterized protein n=1 Tax=Pythium insidiosum TaxID=114742 RepID=A0AAD5M0Z3_PYTIN|nr:hypothetical protein P43SY_011236 [Pythium insidiosum]
MVLFKSWTFLSGTGSLDLSFGYLEIDDIVGPEQPETTPVIQPENLWEKLLEGSDEVTMAKLQQVTIEVSDSERSMSVRELFFHADYSESTTNIHKSRLVSIVAVIQGLLRAKDRGRLHCITLPSTIMSI